MILVFATLLITIVLAFLAQERKRIIYVFLMILVLSLLSGLRRYDVGRDTYNYYLFFNDIINGGSASSKDYGFLVVSRLLLTLFKKPELLMLFYSFLINTLILVRIWTLRKKASFILMILGYLCFYYFQSFNIMRQCLALSIVFFASLFLDKRQYLLYLIFTLFGISIHSSCVVGLIPFVIYTFFDMKRFKKAKFYFFLSLLMFVPLSLYLYNNFSYKYINYFNNIYFDFSPLILFELVLVVFILLLSKKDKLNSDIIYKKSYLIFMIGILLSGLGMFFKYMDRIGIFCTIFELVFWGSFWKMRTKIERPIYISSFVLLCAYCLVSIFVFNGSNIFPYHSIFQV